MGGLPSAISRSFKVLVPHVGTLGFKFQAWTPDFSVLQLQALGGCLDGSQVMGVPAI